MGGWSRFRDFRDSDAENIKIGGRPDDGTRYRAEWFSIERLASETGYRPATGFEDGVRDLLAKRPFDMEAPARSRTSPGTRNS